MKAYKLIGNHVKCGEAWEYSSVFLTLEKAKKQMQIEIAAYTWKGECCFNFEIVEVNVN